MLTNSAFELNPTQLQTYNEWLSKMYIRGREEGEDMFFIDAVEVVFSFTPIGRGVIARIPDSTAEITLESIF